MDEQCQSCAVPSAEQIARMSVAETDALVACAKSEHWPDWAIDRLVCNLRRAAELNASEAKQLRAFKGMRKRGLRVVTANDGGGPPEAA